MFGKRKKERELQQVQEARIEREKKINASIEEAVKTEDPAKKILKLEELRKEINNEVWTEKGIIFKKSNKSFFKIAGTSLVAALGGGAAAAAATLATGGAGILVMFPIAIGGMVIGAKRSRSVEERLKAEVEDHLKNTEAQSVRVTKLIEAEVNSKVEEISTSPLKEKVFNVPGVIAQFADAASKHIITAEEEAQTIVKKKPAAPRKKQKPDFKDLGGV